MLGTSSALHSLKAANIVASWKEGVRKESKAKDFVKAPLICGLLVYGNIVDPVLKEKYT